MRPVGSAPTPRPTCGCRWARRSRHCWRTCVSATSTGASKAAARRLVREAIVASSHRGSQLEDRDIRRRRVAQRMPLDHSPPSRSADEVNGNSTVTNEPSSAASAQSPPSAWFTTCAQVITWRGEIRNPVPATPIAPGCARCLAAGASTSRSPTGSRRALALPDECQIQIALNCGGRDRDSAPAVSLMPNPTET